MNELYEKALQSDEALVSLKNIISFTDGTEKVIEFTYENALLHSHPSELATLRDSIRQRFGKCEVSHVTEWSKEESHIIAKKESIIARRKYVDEMMSIGG
ncbi:hypothetical protein [Rheinheimera soli]|uniref:Demethoxyubiquinone hydroxylase (CLK1/Coq7/Cat5 family) n=1 Tax=Rheinheimera soli TaxID=443616 RepID=A0ABU1VWE2_9GAMM|nr:hypothetical protein [Rheinheimera soli]MDR7119748.1 demethoxyubiquinone hydroxylase (CLK1/Coq7/Cat5 family) [Rheinheimera soli]